MTFGALLKRLRKMTPEQLRQPAKLMEGCSGNWTEVQAVYVARKDEYREGEEPGGDGESRYPREDYGQYTNEPVIKKGRCYLNHDH